MNSSSTQITDQNRDLGREKEEGVDPRLLDACQRLEGRWRARWFLTALLFGLSSLLCLVPFILGLDQLFSQESLPAAIAWTLVISPILITLIAFSLRVWVWPLSKAFFLRTAESKKEECSGFLLAAYELPFGIQTASGDSPAFRSQLQDRAGQLAQTLLPQELFPWRTPQLNWAVKILVVGLVANLVLTFLPSIEYSSRLVHIFAPHSDWAKSRSAQIELENIPSLFPSGDDLLLSVLVKGKSVEECRLEWEVTNVQEEVQHHFAQGENLISKGQSHGEIQLLPVLDDSPQAEVRRFQTTLTRLQSSIKGTVHSKGAQSASFEVKVFPRPRVLSYNKEIFQPDYLGGAQVAQATEDHGDLAALQGSQAKLILKADQPLKEASLHLFLEGEEEKILPMVVEEEAATIERIILEKPGHYNVHLVSAETEFKNVWHPDHSIRVDVDAPPQLEVLQPPHLSLVGSNATLPVELKAEDAVGLDSFWEKITVEGNDPHFREIKKLNGELHARFEAHLDLSLLELTDGSQVELVYQARDLRGTVTTSQAHKIIISNRREDTFEDQRFDQLFQLLKGLHTQQKEGQKLLLSLNSLLADARRGRPKAIIKVKMDKWLQVAQVLLKSSKNLSRKLGAQSQGSYQPRHQEDLKLAQSLLDHVLMKDWEPTFLLLKEEYSVIDQPSENRGAFGSGGLAGVFQIASERWGQGQYKLRTVSEQVPVLVFQNLLNQKYFQGLTPIVETIRNDFELLSSKENDPKQKNQLKLRLEAFGKEIELALSVFKKFPIEGGTSGWLEVLDPFTRDLTGLELKIPQGPSQKDLLAWRDFLTGFDRNTEALSSLEEYLKDQPQKIRKNWWAFLPGYAQETQLIAKSLTDIEQSIGQALVKTQDEIKAARIKLPDALPLSDLKKIFSHPGKTHSRLTLTETGKVRLSAYLGALQREIGALGTNRLKQSTDVLLLSKIIEKSQSLPAIFTSIYSVQKLAEARFSPNLTLLEKLITDWGEKTSSGMVNKQVENLQQAYEAYSILEVSHRLAFLADYSEVLEQLEKKSVAGSLLWAKHAKLQFRDLLNEVKVVAQLSKDRQIKELDLRLEDVIKKLESTRLSRLYRDRERNSYPFDSLQQAKIVESISEVAHALRDLEFKEVPQIHQARERLRSLAPSLISQIQEALTLSKSALDATQKVIEKKIEFSSDALLQSELLAATSLDGLRERFSHEASSLQIEDPQSLVQMRSFDVAVKWLEMEFPGPDAFLIAATVSEGENFNKSLAKATELQGIRVERLELLLEFFQAQEEGGQNEADNVRQKMEDQLGIEEELNQKYEELKTLAGFYQKQLELLNQTKELGQAQESGSPDQEKLDSLKKGQSEVEDALAKNVLSSPHTKKALQNSMKEAVEQALLELLKVRKEQSVLGQRWDQAWVQLLAEEEEKYKVLKTWKAEAQVLIEGSLKQAQSSASLSNNQKAQILEGERVIDETLQAISRLDQAESKRPQDLHFVLKEGSKDLQAIALKTSQAYFEPHPALKAVPPASLSKSQTLLKELEELRGEIRLRIRKLESFNEQSERTGQDYRERELNIRKQIISISAQQSEIDEIDIQAKAKLGLKLRVLRRDLDLIIKNKEKFKVEQKFKERQISRRLDDLGRSIILTARKFENAAVTESANLKSKFIKITDRLTWAAEKLETRDLPSAQRWLEEALTAWIQLNGKERTQLNVYIDYYSELKDLERSWKNLLNVSEDRIEFYKNKIDEFNGQQGQIQETTIIVTDSLRVAIKASGLLQIPAIEPIAQAERILSSEVIVHMNSLRGQIFNGDGTSFEKAQSTNKTLEARLNEVIKLIESFLLQLKAGKKSNSNEMKSDSEKNAGAGSESQAKALTQMGSARESLNRSSARSATQHQSQAVRSLAKALRSKSKAMAQERNSQMERSKGSSEKQGKSSQEGSSQKNAGSQSTNNNNDLNQSNPNADGKGFDQELLNLLLSGKLGEGNWAKLSSELKKQLLKSHRDGISIKYQALVEAYFRALAEEAQSQN